MVKYMGGGITGISSNMGILKAYCLNEKVALNKGLKQIPLNLPFSMERIVGATIYYGSYIGSQAMINETGDYTANYGLSFNINNNTKTLNIYASGIYSERVLTLIIFYV